MQHRIPKRIIQFFIGKQLHQPLRNQAVMSNIRLLNSDFEYMFFDDAKVQDFVDREFPQYRDAFDSFPFLIQRCDFFRYLAVYRYGGFYLDLDVLLASTLSSLQEYECVFPFEQISLSHFLRNNLGMDWQIGNYAFGAAPKHPFIEAVIKNCIRSLQDPDWVKPMMRGSPPLRKKEFFVLNSTGPGLISRTLAENPDLAKTVTVLFPDDVCDRSNWYNFGEIGIHLMDHSWRTRRSSIRLKLADYYWRWMQHRCVSESRRLGKTRFHPRPVN